MFTKCIVSVQVYRFGSINDIFFVGSTINELFTFPRVLRHMPDPVYRDVTPHGTKSIIIVLMHTLGRLLNINLR